MFFQKSDNFFLNFDQRKVSRNSFGPGIIALFYGGSVEITTTDSFQFGIHLKTIKINFHIEPIREKLIRNFKVTIAKNKILK